MKVVPRENTGCIHDAERETVESELSFPLDRNNPKCDLFFNRSALSVWLLTEQFWSGTLHFEHVIRSGQVFLKLVLLPKKI